eukprot:Gregarina_sp_Poly_1__4845@NODE_257_length_10511_cov_261_924071_g224_i0_p5_GENE_NODE_257_length_10511_cov_261_924071_g224_i0NODE_257_length_10511_cov_261_924071_g224_i0_p5_ORF_typecomplete_len224_score4_01Baculo_E56/PF04639_12/0_21DUF4389/PF14333_6/3e03DUF4389/PF14333_6/0_17Baculo_11_kDa/PF06143_11/0_49Orthoreo_P10/PF07204_11/1_5ASFV_J13L/PF05568_11/3_1_NODE_257_length_10511_cov_261_924071_g224_i04251096
MIQSTNRARWHGRDFDNAFTAATVTWHTRRANEIQSWSTGGLRGHHNLADASAIDEWSWALHNGGSLCLGDTRASVFLSNFADFLRWQILNLDDLLRWLWHFNLDFLNFDFFDFSDWHFDLLAAFAGENLWNSHRHFKLFPLVVVIGVIIFIIIIVLVVSRQPRGLNSFLAALKCWLAERHVVRLEDVFRQVYEQVFLLFFAIHIYGLASEIEVLFRISSLSF